MASTAGGYVESSGNAWCAWRFALMLVLGSGTSAPLSGARSDTHVSGVVAELQILASGDLHATEFAIARHTARELLETAGIGVEWRDCTGAVPGCDTSGPERIAIRVRLRTERKTTDVAACGEVARDYLNRPVVVAYLPPHLDLVSAFQFHVAARSNPALGHIRLGHLVGLTLAHEVGHWLGLTHAPSGVMKARLALEEVAALASQRLAFEPQQGSHLRQALRQRSIAVVAGNR
jgi:hypothetical protein